jgi:predicted ester cyclase
MSTAANKALVYRMLKEMNDHNNRDIIDELISEDFIEHEPPPEGIPPNREGTKQTFDIYHSAFANIQTTFNLMIAEDDKVAVFMSIRAKHVGPFGDIPPTNDWVETQVFDIFRVADGKVCEHWGLTDHLTLLKQFGVLQM